MRASTNERYKEFCEKYSYEHVPFEGRVVAEAKSFVVIEAPQGFRAMSKALVDLSEGPSRGL